MHSNIILGQTATRVIPAVGTGLNIVIVDQDDALREIVIDALRLQGHYVTGLSDAESFDDEWGGRPVQLLIVDLDLPCEGGLSLARRFRFAQPSAGIIMMTARNQLQDKVLGYAHGADSYLVKPVDQAELSAVIRALARRIRPAEEEGAFSAITLDLETQRLKGPCGEILVTSGEAKVLTALARAIDRQLESWQLLEQLDAPSASKEVLEVRMVRLRKKLVDIGLDKTTIKAIRGIGYRLCTRLVIL